MSPSDPFALKTKLSEFNIITLPLIDVFHFTGHQEESAAGIKISFSFFNTPLEINIVEPSKLIFCICGK